MQKIPSLTDVLPNLTRRELLKNSFASLVTYSAAPMLVGCHSDAPAMSNLANIGPLQSVPDDNGFLLPVGFSSRVVAQTDEQPVASSSYVWHELPDGGATFATDSGGWIYACNSEGLPGVGGVGALEFNAAGDLVDAFSLLSGTTRNCAGGPTPWQTWLSCEEYEQGLVWECFPLERGARTAISHPAMGVFQHEAAATDPATSIVYLTEDETDGCLYRFIPDHFGNLSAGTLQAAVVDQTDAQQQALEGMVSWVDIADPLATTLTVREQARQAGAAIFRRGEGAWFQNNVVYFTTTVDGAGGGLVWALDISDDPDGGVLTQIYNRVDLFPEDDTLNGVDNVTVSAGGDVLVAEDSDDLQIQALTPGGLLVPLFKLLGHQVFNFPGEIAGPAFDPSGTRLYFSSQRGSEVNFVAQGKPIGQTYEITGPFLV